MVAALLLLFWVGYRVLWLPPVLPWPRRFPLIPTVPLAWDCFRQRFSAWCARTLPSIRRALGCGSKVSPEEWFYWDLTGLKVVQDEEHEAVLEGLLSEIKSLVQSYQLVSSRLRACPRLPLWGEVALSLTQIILRRAGPS